MKELCEAMLRSKGVFFWRKIRCNKPVSVKFYLGNKVTDRLCVDCALKRLPPLQ